MDVREFVLEKLQEEYKFKSGADVDAINYIEEGYVTSIGLFKFVVSIEEAYDIDFSDDEIMSHKFATVGGLIRMIEGKINVWRLYCGRT